MYFICWDFLLIFSLTFLFIILENYLAQHYIYIISSNIMDYIAKVSSNYRGTHPLFGRFLIGVSGISAFLSVYSYFQSKGAEKQIQFRKTQLAKPIYKLTDEEMINPPWNKDNIDEWLYRRVEVSGRPIHRLSCMIPRRVHGGDGFESVVPLVARQNKQRTQREGLLLSQGFIPFIFQHIGSRYRIENVQRQTFVGYVSRLEDLGDRGISGNAVQQGRQLYSQANIDDIAETSGLKNRKQASVAVVERLHETGDLNERLGKRYSNDADFALTYPYVKTETGAITSGKMPWNFKNESKAYLATSLISLIVGASVF